MERMVYIEDANGGYFCYESEKDYFLNEKFKDWGGSVCVTGTKEELEKEFGTGMIRPIFTQK